MSRGDSGRVTHVPIPNTTVKPSSADGTWGASPWESKTPRDEKNTTHTSGVFRLPALQATSRGVLLDPGSGSLREWAPSSNITDSWGDGPRSVGFIQIGRASCRVRV